MPYNQSKRPLGSNGCQAVQQGYGIRSAGNTHHNDISLRDHLISVYSGFYCAQEFDLTGLAPILRQGVELGRACIKREHRHGSALFALWRGLAAYATWSRKRFLFGCCSLTSQDPREGAALLAELARGGHLDARFSAPVRPAFVCAAQASVERVRVELPALFATYLRHGATVLGGPALDREFKTIDYLVALDLARMPSRLRSLFFAGLAAPLFGGGTPRG